MATPEFAVHPLWGQSNTPQPSTSIPLDVAETAGQLTRAILAIHDGDVAEAAQVAMTAARRLESLAGVASQAPPLRIPPSRPLATVAADLGAIAEALDSLAEGDAVLRALADDTRNASYDAQGWADVLGLRLDVAL